MVYKYMGIHLCFYVYICVFIIMRDMHYTHIFVYMSLSLSLLFSLSLSPTSSCLCMSVCLDPSLCRGSVWLQSLPSACGRRPLTESSRWNCLGTFPEICICICIYP